MSADKKELNSKPARKSGGPPGVVIVTEPPAATKAGEQVFFSRWYDGQPRRTAGTRLVNLASASQASRDV